MNTSEQKSKLTKDIFNKVDEFKEWSAKLEQVKIDYTSLSESLNKERDEYFKLDKGFDSYKIVIDEKKELLNLEIDQLQHQITDLQNKIVNLSNKLEEERENFDHNIDVMKGLTINYESRIEEKKKEINTFVTLKEKVSQELDILRDKKTDLDTLISFRQVENKQLDEVIISMKDFIADIRKREQDIVIRETRVFEKEKKLKQK